MYAPLRKILLATDGSKDAALAAAVAADLCGKTGSELQVIHVGQDISEYGWYVAKPEKHPFVFADEARKLLDEQVESIKRAGSTVAEAHLKFGDPADEIVALAEGLEGGLIVLGSRGLGLVERLILGSVAEGVVHQAPCPVLVLRGGERSWPPSSVLIGDDSSREAGEAGELAARIGGFYGADAVVVRAYPSLPREVAAAEARRIEDELRRAEEDLEGRAGKLEGLLGKRPRVRVAVGDAAALILDEAWPAEPPALIAVGARGFDAAERGSKERMMLGSVSTKVLRTAKGPVLLCPRRRG